MSPMLIEKLMNHSIGISDHYGKPTELDYFRQYLQVVPHLSINKQIAMEQVSETQQQLELRMESKDKQIQTLSDKVDLLFRGLYQLHNITQKDFDEHTEDERFNIVKGALMKAKTSD
jgi:hypothetical protein